MILLLDLLKEFSWFKQKNNNRVKLKTGETISLEVKDVIKSSNYTSLSVIAYSDSGSKIGQVYFDSEETNNKNKLTSSDTSIKPEWRRKGVATAMYQYVKDLGYEVLPSSDQTPEGAEFFKSLKP
jgi:predicted GNAT family acetyltransferase